MFSPIDPAETGFVAAGCGPSLKERTIMQAIIAITFVVMVTAPCVIAMRLDAN